MKNYSSIKLVPILLILTGFITICFSQQVAWQKMKNLPEGKTSAVGEIDGKIYIMGSGSTSKVFLEYDPVTDTYKKCADLPVCRSSHPAGVAANSHFYTLGGNVQGGGAAVLPVHAYDPKTDGWTHVTDFPTGRYLLRVCACDGKIFTGGAYYVPKVMEIYDPVSESWEDRSGNAPSMGAQAMCSYNGKIYCFGGAYGLHDVWEYDPATDTWTQKSPMPTGRSAAVAACVDGKIYVFGGAPDAVYPNEAPLDVVEAYDPETDTWYVDYPAMPTPRFWAGACTVDSLIYVIGGYQANWGQGAQLVNEVFNPALAEGTEYTETPDASEQTWQLQFDGTHDFNLNQKFSPIKFVDKNTGWIGGTNGVFGRTTDGGETWIQSIIPGAEKFALYSIAALDADNAHIIAARNGDARIYKTIDGGASWFMAYQNKNAGAFLNAITFWDAQNGIAVGDPVNGEFLILTTKDGGYSWQPVPADKIPDPKSAEWGPYAGYGGNGLAVWGENHAWFGTGYGSSSSNNPLRVLYSTDKGQTWNVSDTPLPTTGQFHGITTITFKDEMVGFAASHGSDEKGTGKNLVKTTDGGQTWSVVDGFVKSNSQTSTIVFVPGTQASVVLATTAGGLACSGDGGNNWRVLDNDTFYGMSFISPTEGWGTTNYGLIGHYGGDAKIYVDVNNSIGSVVPESFLLNQNYPNPFNPSTTISYTLPKATFVSLKVYDLLGREIRTLVNEQQMPGTHSAVFNASDLSSAVYLYKLEGDGFSHIRKLMLIK